MKDHAGISSLKRTLVSEFFLIVIGCVLFQIYDSFVEFLDFSRRPVPLYELLWSGVTAGLGVGIILGGIYTWKSYKELTQPLIEFRYKGEILQLSTTEVTYRLAPLYLVFVLINSGLLMVMVVRNFYTDPLLLWRNIAIGLPLLISFILIIIGIVKVRLIVSQDGLTYHSWDYSEFIPWRNLYRLVERSHGWVIEYNSDEPRMRRTFFRWIGDNEERSSIPLGSFTTAVLSSTLLRQIMYYRSDLPFFGRKN